MPKQYQDESAVEVSGGTLKLKIMHDPRLFNLKDWNGDIINPSTMQPYQVTINHKVGIISSKEILPWCICECGSGERYRCPCSEKDYSQRFGFFEIRCKLPSSKAIWPAFWLSGAVEWPPEIDVFEMFTSKSFKAFESNYHWGKEKDCFEHSSDSKKHDVNNVSENFHIYACEWDSCFIKWYYDNLLVRVAHKNVTNVFERMKIIVSNGIDDLNNKSMYEPHSYSSDKDRLDLPNYENELIPPAIFEVDYVRAYKKD